MCPVIGGGAGEDDTADGRCGTDNDAYVNPRDTLPRFVPHISIRGSLIFEDSGTNPRGGVL